jgi:hypothetical protein
MRTLSSILTLAFVLIAARVLSADGQSDAAPGNGIVDDPALQERVEKACAKLAESIDTLLGKRFPGPVTVRIATREFIREFAREAARKQTPEGELDIAVRLAVRLRQIPPGLDLMEKQLELLEKQVVGLYDPDTDTFYVVQHAGEPPSAIFMITAAHELVHAYRDVGGDYWERTLATIDTDADWAIAITCLVEGDATLLGQPVGAAAIQQQDAGPLLEWSARSARQTAAQMQAAVGMLGLDDFPFALREMLLGRYAIGLVFAGAIHDHGGLPALAAAYARPPRSTEQVLHPEKYLAEKPDEPTIFSGGDPTRALGEGWTLGLANTSGEFDLRIQFTELLGRERAEKAAAGWDGIRFFFCEKEGTNGFLGLVSTWDTAEDAMEFAEAWIDWACLRDGRETEARLSERYTWTADTADGLVVVDIMENDVFVADGVPADRVDEVMAALEGAERRERRADENLAAAGD